MKTPDFIQGTLVIALWGLLFTGTVAAVGNVALAMLGDDVRWFQASLWIGLAVMAGVILTFIRTKGD